MKLLIPVIIAILIFSPGNRLSAGPDADLISAASSGTIDEVKSALKAGADVNAKDDGARTPLILVAQNMSDIDKYKEISSVLVTAGARVNEKDAKGMTALMWASGQGSPVIAKLLISAGADTGLKDKNGMTALMFAANFSQMESVKALIKAGAKVNEQDNAGWTALLHAIKGAFEPDIVDYLISKGASVNMKSQGGWTPLMEAAAKGKAEIVKALIKAKADVNAKSDEGRTALGYASMMLIDTPDSPFKEVVDLLTKAGGK